MNTKQLRALEKHAQAAADLITGSVVTTAADVLAATDSDPRDSLAALVDAGTLYRIANDARDARKVTP